MTQMTNLIKAMLVGAESVLGDKVKFNDLSTGSSWRIKATLGRSTHIETDYGGNQMEEQTVDFIVRLTELERDGQVVYPQRGDTIEYNGETFAVLPDMTEQSNGWSWLDNSRSSIRIHTKEI